MRVEDVLVAEGWCVHRVHFVKDHKGRWRQQDIFGFGDIVAYRGDALRLVQVTDGGDLAHRVAKAPAGWSGALGSLEVWSRLSDDEWSVLVLAGGEP